MPPAWIEIQRSTFTRWVHVQLDTDVDGDGIVDEGKEGASEAAGLDTVFKNGTNLIKVLERVMGKDIGKKYKADPKLKVQQLDNLTAAFAFMEANGVKLVNISPEDIWNGSIKLVLGMIWTIIYQFQVSRMDIDGTKNAKEALLEWIQEKIPENNIKNFDKDWRDGTALIALTNALGKPLYAGDMLIPDVPGDPLANATAGINAAHAKLSVAKLLTPEILTNPDCDEHSMVTYLSMFRDAKRPEDPEPAPVQAKVVAKPVMEATPVMEAAAAKVVTGPVLTKPEPAGGGDSAAAGLPPPEERAADWRTYEGIDLGGRLKIRVFFSTTTSNLMIRKNTEAMQKLLEAKKVHLRPDFDPWIPVDMDMDREHRNKIFEKAGQRETPMLFIDDEFIGGYDAIVEMNEVGLLDKALKY